MYRVNVRGFRYAVLEKDTIDTLIYGEIKEIRGTMTIGLTPTVAAGELFGDGVKATSEQAQTGIDVAVEMNKIPIEDRAIWLGNKYDENGILHESGTDITPRIAVGFIVDLTGGGMEIVWLLKCNVSPIANNNQQRATSINYSTDSFSIKAEYRIFDNDIKQFGDTTAETGKLTKEKAQEFLKSVPGNQMP